MSFEIQWDVAGRSVETADDVLRFLAGRDSKVNNWGTRGMAYWIGPSDADPEDFPLRIDVDPDVEAAAVRWLPDNLVGVSRGFQYGRSIRVLEDSGDPLVEIPAALVRATIDTAKQAAADYISTGQRPRTIVWEPVARV